MKRIDDNMESIKKRFATYKDITLLVVEEFRKQKKVRQVNGEGTKEEIFKEITTIFNRKKLQ